MINWPRKIRTLAEQMESFEASKSVKNTGTGTRREGEKFESLVNDFWVAVGDFIDDNGCDSNWYAGPSNRCWRRLTCANRSVYLPSHKANPITSDPRIKDWLKLDFLVQEVIENYPGTEEAIKRYAPQKGPYAGDNYTSQFSELKTRFDDTILFEDNGNL